MQRQFSGKDSDTPSFLEDYEQENKLHYEKVEGENWISLMQLTGLIQNYEKL